MSKLDTTTFLIFSLLGIVILGLVFYYYKPNFFNDVSKNVLKQSTKYECNVFFQRQFVLGAYKINSVSCIANGYCGIGEGSTNEGSGAQAVSVEIGNAKGIKRFDQGLLGGLDVSGRTFEIRVCTMPSISGTAKIINKENVDDTESFTLVN